MSSQYASSPTSSRSRWARLNSCKCIIPNSPQEGRAGLSLLDLLGRIEQAEVKPGQCLIRLCGDARQEDGHVVFFALLDEAQERRNFQSIQVWDIAQIEDMLRARRELSNVPSLGVNEGKNRLRYRECFGCLAGDCLVLFQNLHYPFLSNTLEKMLFSS